MIGSQQRSFTQVPEFDNFGEAMYAALERSFINDCVVSAVYGPTGDFVGRALGGMWSSASDLKP